MQGVDEQKEMPTSSRSTWITGSLCQIYSASKQDWFDGEIVQIFTDKEGEWLKVVYDGTTNKQVQRWCDDIRPNDGIQTQIQLDDIDPNNAKKRRPSVRIDDALARYYGSFGKKYQTVLKDYYDDNDLDDNCMEEQFADPTDDNQLVDEVADQQIPLHQRNVSLSDKEKKEFLHSLIMRCHKYPGTEFAVHFPFINADFCVPPIGTMETEQKLYKKYSTWGWYDESTDLLRLLAIGRVHKMEYFLSLWSHYIVQREPFYRTNDNFKTMTFDEIYKMQGLTHILDLQKIKLSSKKSAMDSLLSAFEHFNRKCFSCLECSSLSSRIVDSIHATMQYFISALELIHKHKKNAPFQMDLCIVYEKIVDTSTIVGANSPFDDEDSDDDEEKDTIGNIKARLESNELNHIRYKEPDGMHSINMDLFFAGYLREFDIQYPTKVVHDLISMFFGQLNFRRIIPIEETFDQFKEFLRKSKDKIPKVKSYPKYKRFITFVDRREENDAMWMTEPLSDSNMNCRDIPQDDDNVPELWYLNATKMCLLPRMPNSSSPAAGPTSGGSKLLTFSFHVKSKDCIQCYLFAQGMVIRIFHHNIFDILQELFTIHDLGDEMKKMHNEKIELMLIDTMYRSFCDWYLVKY